MSKSLKYLSAAALPMVATFTIAYNFADRNITQPPLVAERTIPGIPIPEPQPIMSAQASTQPMEPLGLGREALPEEIAAWDIDIAPDGTGLPVGAMDVWAGEETFVEYCAVCHGDFAEGAGNWPKLAGGRDTLADEDPLKTVGSYWPHLTTAFDYINRSMPFGNAQSLSADEVYGIVNYILYSNDLVDDDFVLSNENFMEVVLPNAEGFIIDDRKEAEAHFWTDTPCMSDCKETVEITMRAAVLDVTPEEEGDDMRTEDHAADASDTETVTEVASAEEETATDEAAPTEAVAEVAALDPELVGKGERLFRQCQACHKVGEGARNGSGPMLNGIVGATAGQVDGFRYSNALAEAGSGGLVWNAETLSAFLTDPRGFMPGTKMSFRGLRSEEDTEAVIAYLTSHSQ